MSWFIDAEEYRDEFMSGVYAELSDDPDWYRANRIIDLFDDAPAADVAPVRNGKWIPDDSRAAEAFDLHVCSVCGSESFREEDNWGVQFAEELTPYCPYCGAKLT